MMYKAMKREQIRELKKESRFKEMIEAMVLANDEAFGDIRNLLFDREIGTNLLTEFATTDRAKDMLAICREVQ